MSRNPKSLNERVVDAIQKNAGPCPGAEHTHYDEWLEVVAETSRKTLADFLNTYIEALGRACESRGHRATSIAGTPGVKACVACRSRIKTFREAQVLLAPDSVE